MPTDRDVWLEGLRLPDSAARRLLVRAGELDGPQSGIPVAELRQAAIEAGISSRAFDAALGELWLDIAAAGLPSVDRRPGGALARPEGSSGGATSRRRRPTLLIGAGLLFLGGVLVGGIAAREPSPTYSRTVREVAIQPATPQAVSPRTYFEFEVERPVAALNQTAPVYPPALQAQGVSGEVIAQFVVDESGRVDAGTFKVIESTHALFASAVEQALPRMRFSPAELGGRPVRQLVQQPFLFQLGR